MSDDPEIVLVSPQFDREDGKTPAPAPDGREEFAKLRDLDADRLEELGLRKWSSDSGLWLFPGEWFDAIPEGFEVTTINGETLEFDPAEESDDRRFGCLAYGVTVTQGNP